MTKTTRLCWLTWVCATAAMGAASGASPTTDPSSQIEIDQVQIVGHIDGRQLAVTVSFEAGTKQPSQRMVLVQGQAVLDKLDVPMTDGWLDYDPNEQAYHVTWPQPGRHHVSATFQVQSVTEPNGAVATWRQASLQVPSGRVRQVRLVSRRNDLDVQLPGALQVQYHSDPNERVVEGLLGPHEPVRIRWKPQVQLTGVKPVWSSQANTIVDVRAGLVQVDALFDFQVAQGKIESLLFNVPAGLSITALQGSSIRTWVLGDIADGVRPLRVELSQPQEKEYHLRIQAEAALDKLPSTAEVPTIEPVGGIRAGGFLAVGTNSALQLVVQESSGLTQVDGAAFPRVQTPQSQVRPIPQGKAFFYTYTGSRYRLRLLVDDIVPTYDVAGRFVARIKEDDLVVDADLELDIRDAPVRQLEVVTPAGLTVAAVDGNQVEDYHVPEALAAGRTAAVRVIFKEPVIGRTLLHLRLELGRGPLGERQTIPALQVTGAKTQRGYVVIAAETGIEIDQPQTENLREVHTASVPLRVAQAQYAYRFRDADWTLNLLAKRRAAEVRAEVFQLQSIGEALAHGSAVVNYLITGSPVDELTFRLPDSFENVEFVGSDVRRWVRQGDAWIVKLTRKVLGDYSLAATYTQRYDSNRPIQLGALTCQDVQTQTGYVVVTSPLDLKLQLAADPNAGQAGLLPIALDELPGDYRLLTSSPILAAYKYVAQPHTAMLAVNPYQRSSLLPVVVDIADLQTRFAVRPDGQIESVTTVRCKIKNTTGQFLALGIPADARVWSVSSIEARPGAPEQSIRLAASHDQGSGQLLIPLRRQANPNDPVTIELEYGQIHKISGWWQRRIELTAPRCVVPIAYADWRIAVPERWTLASAGGNMQTQSNLPTGTGLAALASQIGSSWAGAMHRWSAQSAVWIMGVIVTGMIVILALFRRAWLPDLVEFVVLSSVVWIGVEAGMDRLVPPTLPTSLSYAQAVSMDRSQALHVAVDLAPAWRQAVSILDIMGAAVIVIAGLGMAVARKRLWKVAIAAALAALIYLAAKTPVAWPVLKALMTWLIPVVALVWFAYRLWRRQAMPTRAIASMSILLLVFAGGGCSVLGSGSPSIPARSMIERLECSLTAGADSMELKYNLRISADRPSRFGLLDESAVLLSSAKPAGHVELQVQDGRHVVHVEEPGLYDVEVTFLVPLPPAKENQQREFELALPVALSNRVRLVIPDANVLVEAPQAAFLARDQEAGQTRVEAMFSPGQPARFTWRPRERQAAQEEVRFYAQDMALASVTPGLVQVYHAVRLQIAQGQIDKLTLDIAQGQTVTSVNGPNVGAWRFDPASHRLDIRLNQPATGSYSLNVVTQAANASVPYDIRVEPLAVELAVDQHSAAALAAEPSVYVRLDQHPAAMNVQDFVREAGDLIKAVPGLAVEQIGQAFRFEAQGAAVTGRVLAVQSEVRSQETARFNVEDERLVYNSLWDIEIAKAGRFDVDLLVPEGFDIDALEAQEMSHWDEATEANQRHVSVHFKRKLIGSVQLRLALSRAIPEIPDRLTVPRVMVAGAIKHAGHLVIGSQQGVRLSVASRQGVSEVNPAELGQSGQGLLAFQFLRPDWQLELQTELIQARVTVQSLHVARVTDGLVRHQHYLRYRLYHAGTKTFALTLPAEAVGVTITGPGIARREQSGPGQWKVELADKVYDQPYLMGVTYETRYDPADGNIPLVPVRCQDADLQQGYAAVFATDRVELAAGATDAALRPADARSIPEYFGAGDLSAAAMCYRSISSQYSLTVRATRHAAAEQIGAEVLRTDLASVVTADGQTINRVILQLRVGTQRHLQTVLPEGAAIWSLAVDGQAVQPSIRTTAEGRSTLLVPLPQETPDDVMIDMLYVGGLPSESHAGLALDWSGRHTLSGPRFDLPLKNITWQVFLPQGFSYGDFGGTVTADPQAAEGQNVLRYDMQTYQRQILEVNRWNEQVAEQQQSRARELAQKGEQTAARQALTKGYNFSIGNTALNEDIRVDLDNLLRQQAKVGLINARGRLRQQTGGSMDNQAEAMIPLSGQGFSQQQAERIANSLGQADNENLELIIRRVIQTQAAAEAPVSQLHVTMPVCGQMLQFRSPLQVEPAAPMTLAFTARGRHLAQIDPSLWYGLGLFVVLMLFGAAVKWIDRLVVRLHKTLMPSPVPAIPSQARLPVEKKDEPDSRVSAEELL